MANYVKPNSITITKKPNKSVYDLKETICLYVQYSSYIYWFYGPARNTPSLAGGYERRFDVPFEISYSSPGSYVVSCGYGEYNTSICIPSQIIGGNDITVSWGASTYSDWNLSGYILECKADSGAWTQVYKGSSRSATVAIATSWNSVQFRVKAYNSAGATSSYRTSEVYTVIDNRVPVISGSNQNLGSFSDIPPTYSYTVSDADGDEITVAEMLDDIVLYRDIATSDERTITVSAEIWQKVLNGSHTLGIQATDSKGGSTTRTLTFRKEVTSIVFEQVQAMPADDMPIRAMVNIQGNFPQGSILKIEICNNGNDEIPAWEDITSKVLQEKKCYFNNTEKTAENWGVKLRASLEKGTATEPCYIQSLGGNFG